MRLGPPSPSPALCARLLARRQRDALGQIGEGVLLVGERHRGDEMALEVRLDRRLDLVDAPHDALDLRARGKVEKRDPRAGSRRIAGARDLREIAIGNEAERHRIERIDVAAEGAGERDALRARRRRAPSELRAGIKRGLGELDRAHVGLIDEKPWRAFVQHVGEGAADLLDARGSARRASPSITPSSETIPARNISAIASMIPEPQTPVTPERPMSPRRSPARPTTDRSRSP